MDNKKYYIYAHFDSDGKIFYIGLANNLRRPASKIGRNYLWRILAKKGFTYEILHTVETMAEARKLEKIEIIKNADFSTNLTGTGKMTFDTPINIQNRIDKIKKEIIKKENRGRPTGTVRGVKKMPVTVMLKKSDLMQLAGPNGVLKDGIKAAKMIIINNFSILIMLITLLIIPACKKCGTCHQTVVTSVTPYVTGYPQTTNTTFDACGDDLKDAPGSSTTTSTSQGYTITVKETTTCQ